MSTGQTMDQRFEMNVYYQGGEKNENGEDVGYDCAQMLMFQKGVGWKKHFVALHEMLRAMEYEQAWVRDKLDGTRILHYNY